MFLEDLSPDELKQRLSKAEDFIRARGYRRCSMAACNCNSWHGGDAEDRLREIRALFDDAGIGNGKTISTMVQELISRAGY